MQYGLFIFNLMQLRIFILTKLKKNPSFLQNLRNFTYITITIPCSVLKLINSTSPKHVITAMMTAHGNKIIVWLYCKSFNDYVLQTNHPGWLLNDSLAAYTATILVLASWCLSVHSWPVMHT